MEALVLAVASVARVTRSVQHLATRHPGIRVTVAVPEVERWKFNDTGLTTWTVGEHRLRLDSPAVRRAIAAGRFDRYVIPLGLPTQPPFFLARWVRSVRGRRFILDCGRLPRLRSWLAVWLALVAYGLLCWGPVDLTLRIGRFFDAAALLGWQLLARGRRRRRAAVDGAPVCHIINTLGTGGAQRQLVEYLRHTSLAPVRLLVLYEYNELFLEELQQAGLEAEILYDICRRNPIIHACAWLAPSCTMLVLLWRRLRQLRPSATFSWLFMTNVVAVPAARLAGVPRVISSVRNMSEWKRWPQFRRWWYARADRLTAALSDCIAANAQAVAADYAGWTGLAPEQVQVIANGIDAAALLARPTSDIRSALAIPAGEPVVVTMGRLALEKNQAMLVRCCAEARDRGQPFRLVIVGHGDRETELRELSASLRLEEMIIFAGKTAEPQSYYRAADLFVLSSWIEGMPNAIMEAQAFGVAVVTTDCGGAAEVVVHGDTGLVVRRGDETAMTDAIVALLADPNRRAEMGRRAAARMGASFTIKAMAEAIDRHTRG